MKYAFQIFITMFLPSVLWLLAHSNKAGLTPATVNIFLKKINIALFVVGAIVSLISYCIFVSKELKAERAVCYTKAQWICLLDTFIASAYAYVTYEWVVALQTGESMVHVDILYSVVDAVMVVVLVVIADLLSNIFLRRSFFPFLGVMKSRKRALQIAVEKEYLTQAQKDEILLEQKET